MQIVHGIVCNMYMFLGYDKSVVTFTEINTLYNGRCFVWSMDSVGSGRAHHMVSLYLNISKEATLFASLHPESDSTAPILNTWNFHPPTVLISYNMFYEKEIKKIIRQEISSSYSPCESGPETKYYYVSYQHHCL
jgi:hypothetical protein